MSGRGRRTRPVILTDEDIRRAVRPQEAIAWMREAILAHHHGELIAPARVSAPLDRGAIVMTAGSATDGTYGYRIYDTFGLPSSEQVVVAHDATGKVVAIATGSELGVRRTAAIGGVAHDALAPRRPLSVGIVGTGRQARGQLWALQAVREVLDVRIFRRDPAAREEAAAEIARSSGVRVSAASSSHEAVDGADVVILATTSTTPVIRTAWLRSDAYVAALGPKQPGRAEYDDELLGSARIIATDSIEQLDGMLASADAQQAMGTISPLARHVSAPVRPSGLRVYLSVGLAGTEPYLLRRLAHRAWSAP